MPSCGSLSLADAALERRVKRKRDGTTLLTRTGGAAQTVSPH
jgi:hypothetical protein